MSTYTVNTLLHGTASVERQSLACGNTTTAPLDRGPPRLVVWAALVGLFTPKTLGLYVAGLFFSPGRIALALLLVPSLATFFRRRSRRRLLGADLAMFALSIWMLGGPLFQEHSTLEASLATSGSEVLELLGAYLVGRAYISTRSALEYFTQALAATTIVITGLAVLDTISGHAFIYDLTAGWSGVPHFWAMARSGFVRAQSTLDHPILFGAFEATCITIFLHIRIARHLFYTCIAAFGLLLSLSSGPLLACVTMVGSYWYGRLLNNYPWRWTLYWSVVGALFLAVFLLANSPIGWIIDHLTFDAQNGYFRLASWYASFDQIAESPWIGFFKQKYGNDFLDTTVDCVWLVCALIYGLPTIALLLLANLASFRRTPSRRLQLASDDGFLTLAGTGFTAALVVLMLIGLTVHYWNTMWMFWGLCIGIRTSILEQQLAATTELAYTTRRALTSARTRPFAENPNSSSNVPA